MRAHERPVLTTTDTKSGGLKEAERTWGRETHRDRDRDRDTERERERGRDRVGLREKTCGRGAGHFGLVTFGCKTSESANSSVRKDAAYRNNSQDRMQLD